MKRVSAITAAACTLALSWFSQGWAAEQLAESLPGIMLRQFDRVLLLETNAESSAS
jgi:hypothetical protein